MPTTRSSIGFSGPLTELVALALHRPSLEALASGGSVTDRPPIDRSYVQKILDEEIGRQFGQPLRPIVELVLNGIDAAPMATVDVRTAPGLVVVADRGRGMGLVAILSRLLLPFSTDKQPGVDIGRFGVGFFSVLGFGLADPQSFDLTVETGDGATGWSLHVRTPTARACDAVATLSATEPRIGTTVCLASALLEPATVATFVRDALHFFPAERAVIRLDGLPVNDGSLISGGRLYEESAGPFPARFHLGGRGLSPGILAATYHAGVKVESCFALSELALIDFPACVELTEGRDALKAGPAFAAVARSFYARIANLGDERRTDPPTRCRLAELAAQISALMLQSMGWREAAPELAAALLGPSRCLVSADRAEAVTGFLGPTIVDRLFVPESFWAERQWQGHVPNERDLLEDELVIDPPGPLSVVAASRPELAGLAALARRVPNADARMIALARGKRRPPGVLPCLGTRHAVLVRADARAVRAPRGWTDAYALWTSFDRAAGSREADVERDLIVGAPLAR